MWYVVGIVLSVFCCFAGAKKKVLDLGEIEITGEIRRPNVNLVYSKKYFSKAMNEMARHEFKQFEAELLKPAKGFNANKKSSARARRKK